MASGDEGAFFFVVGLLIGAGGVHCYKDRSAPPVQELHAKIADLEFKLASERKTRDDKFEGEIGLSKCLIVAEDHYWNYVRLNGRVAKVQPNGDKVYRAPMATWEQAARDKTNAIEECKLTWK